MQGVAASLQLFSETVIDRKRCRNACTLHIISTPLVSVLFTPLSLLPSSPLMIFILVHLQNDERSHLSMKYYQSSTCMYVYDVTHDGSTYECRN